MNARSWMQLGGLLGFVVLGYFAVLPALWPSPRITVEMPEKWPIDRDMPITIRVSSWHSNVVVREVRFGGDYWRGKGDGDEKLLPEIMIPYTGPGRGEWKRSELSRFTWPCTQEITANVRMARAYKAGAIEPGMIEGKVLVNLHVPQMGGRRTQLRGVISSRHVAQTQEYTIELTKPQSFSY